MVKRGKATQNLPGGGHRVRNKASKSELQTSCKACKTRMEGTIVSTPCIIGHGGWPLMAIVMITFDVVRSIAWL